jgi:hypothetical protein
MRLKCLERNPLYALVILSDESGHLRFSDIPSEAKAHYTLDLAKMNFITALDHHFNLAEALGVRCVEGENLGYISLGLFAKLEKFVFTLIAHDLGLACELQA